MTAVNNTSQSLKLRYTVHITVFLFTQILWSPAVLLRHVVYCLFCVRACCRGRGVGRTIFHKAPCAPLVHVSKHDTAASVTHLFPLCSPCMSKVCRMGVVLHLQTGPSGAGGISAAKGHGFFLTRSKSRRSHFIMVGTNHTSLSLGQTEGLGG